VVDLANEARSEERLEREGHRRLRDACSPRDLRPRDGCVCTEYVEYGLLVEVLEEWWGSARLLGLASHIVRHPNQIHGQIGLTRRGSRHRLAVS
jgi:hypothetical protein